MIEMSPQNAMGGNAWLHGMNEMPLSDQEEKRKREGSTLRYGAKQ